MSFILLGGRWSISTVRQISFHDNFTEVILLNKVSTYLEGFFFYVLFLFLFLRTQTYLEFVSLQHVYYSIMW